MNDALIFIIGTGVFAVTTTATLLYGYRWFTHKAIEDGVDVGEGWDVAVAPPTGDDISDGTTASILSIGNARGRRVTRAIPLQ